MADAPTYCLGLQLLGECTYKPAAPFGVYFSLGEAISALALTVAVQQLLKPVLHLRLAARSLTINHLYAALFLGAAAVLVSAILPHVPPLHDGPWGFPVVWEAVGALIFAAVYAVVIWVISRPAVATPRNMVAFCRASARLLSSASDADRTDYVRDLAASAVPLIEAAAFIERHSERITAFWEFIHRKKIEQGSIAWELLRLLADPHFCRVAVRQTPWSVAGIMQEIDARNLHAEAAAQFVKEIAFQAVFDDESMMIREASYTGFGTAPLLTDSIFRSQHIITTLDPFDWLFSADRRFSVSTLNRFCKAFEAATETLIEGRTFHRVQAMYSCHRTFETIARFCNDLQRRKSDDYTVALAAAQCFQTAAALARRAERECTPGTYAQMFRTAAGRDYAISMFGVLVDDTYEGLEGVANHFAGLDDLFWSMGHNLVRTVYGRFGGETAGMTPLQQRLSMKILRKVRDNMNGYYPAITRVMLAMIGPYNAPPDQTTRSSFNILRDAFYAELKSLRVLAARSPEKVLDYLPPNVTYDVTRDVLVHTYSGGSTTETDLRALNYLVPLDLTHPANLCAQQPKPDPD